MFFLSYMLSELRRRVGRTVSTVLGLALGVGLVVAVTALSSGLDRAQSQVLDPLTGVGTDMSVSRPITLPQGTSGGGPGFLRLPEKERRQLQEENGGARVGLRNLGEPGTKFSRDDFLATSQLSFPATRVTSARKVDGVASAAGGLTLNAIHVEGTVPDVTASSRGFAAPGPGEQGPRDIDLSSLTVTGVDTANRELGAITPGQISSGAYFSADPEREAILNVAYARRQQLGIGDSVTVGGRKLKVVGLAKTPLGGQAADVYVELGLLQKLSKRAGRVNTIYVRAEEAGDVAAVSKQITQSFPGASVTTATDLADRVSGSLVDAKELTDKLGWALALVALGAAFLIAVLLTLSSVTKRVREIGTLKALGWPQRLVVRQVTGEALLQGLLAGAVGILVGLGGAAVIDALAPTLEASVAQAQQGPLLAGPFGQGAVTTGSTEVSLDAPVDASLLALAIGLALLGGLIAGAAGSLRAARLRPAEALRRID